MTQRTLARLIAAMLACAAGALMFAALKTLSPSEGTKAEAPAVQIPPIPSPGYAYVTNPRSTSTYPTELLLVRDQDGRLSAFEVPTKLGRHTLPDFKWWKPEYICHSFAPDFAAAELRCSDQQASQWIRANARWTLAGRAVTAGLETMVQVQGHESAGLFVLGPM